MATKNEQRFKMSLPTRSLFLAALIALSHLGARSTGSWLTVLPALPPKQELGELPFRLGDWQGADVPLSQALLDEIDAASVMNRIYRNQQGELIEAHAADFTNFDIGPPHFPPNCYRGNGWMLKSTRIVPLVRARGEPAEIVIYLFERNGLEAMVAFWMQADKETFYDRDGLRRLHLRLRATGGRLPLLKKVMLHTPVDTVDRAEQRLLSLSRPLFDAVKALK